LLWFHQARQENEVIMEHLYDISQVSRQSFHEWRQPSARQLSPSAVVLAAARQVRQEELPGVGARKLYRYLGQHQAHQSVLQGWGKHRFEQLCLHNGLRLVPIRPKIKTTQRGDYVFPNLVSGLEISATDRIWVSDMAYVFCGTSLLGYTTTVEDAYSRFLLALVVSQTLQADDTIVPAIQQAIQYRNLTSSNNLVFHSDAGKQYIQKRFLKILHHYNIRSSMAENALENAYSERINGTIKNEYIYRMGIRTLEHLQQAKDFIWHSYNFVRPHQSLGFKTPFEFEQQHATLQPCQRTVLKIKEIKQ
jgi:putative transposase